MYKDLLYCFFVLMPSFACLSGIALVALNHQNRPLNGWLVACGICMAVCSLFEAAFLLIPDKTIFIVVIDVLFGTLSLFIYPGLYIWWRDVADAKRVRREFYLLFVLPILMLFMFLVFYRILGSSNIHAFINDVNSYQLRPVNFAYKYYIVLTIVQYLLLMMESGILLVYVLIDGIRHWNTKPRSDYDIRLLHVCGGFVMLNIIYFMRTSASVCFMQNHPVFCCTVFFLSALTYFLFFFYASHLITEKEDKDEKADTLPTYASIRLRKDFDKLMDEEQYFLQPNITIQHVADKLLTCRTYVVKLMANNVGEDFSDYITRRRIEYACECMLKERAITQEELAHRCGYADAAMFNKKFKAQTGKTPKTWLSEQP